jgi:hypothetical protein
MKKPSRRTALAPFRRFRKSMDTNEDVTVTIAYLMKKLPTRNGSINFRRALLNAINALTEEETTSAFVMVAMNLPSSLRSTPQSRISDLT